MLFAGVEGGATRGSVMICDADGVARARAESAAIVVGPAGHEDAVARILALIETALASAGGARPLAAVYCGLSGAGREPERAAVEALLAASGIARAVRVTTDIDVAFVDAFADGSGILLIAGTGSAAWGRAPDGRTARAGGWGPLAGDEGSAFAIGCAALRAALAAHDGRAPSTGLVERVLRAASVTGPAALVRWADAAGRHGIAVLAQDVLALASTDETCAAITLRATDDLARHVDAIARRLQPWPGTVDVALAGGLIGPGRPLRSAVEQAIREALPAARIDPHAIDGARGAALLARRVGSI